MLDPKNSAASKMNAVADATTIGNRKPKRDAHLKPPDFFDVSKYPSLAFQSKSISNASGRILVRGDRGIRGVAREFVLTAEPHPPKIIGTL